MMKKMEEMNRYNILNPTGNIFNLVRNPFFPTFW
jgi:hypothetical protein